MCVGCREMKEKKALLRIVRNAQGEISFDRIGKAPGRGAYICDNPECFAKLKKGKLLNKTFSCPVEDSVYDGLSEELLGK